MDSSCLSNAAYWQEAGGKQPPPEGKKRKRKTASICEQQEGSRQRKHEPGHSSQHKMKSHTHLSSSFSCSCFVFARSTVIFAMSSPACSALASVSGNARNSSPSAPSTKRPCLLWPGFPAGSPPPRLNHCFPPPMRRTTTTTHHHHHYQLRLQGPCWRRSWRAGLRLCRSPSSVCSVALRATSSCFRGALTTPAS